MGLQVLLAFIVACALCCAGVHAQPALKDVFKNDFLVGAALNPTQFTPSAKENPEVALIKRHFNAITPENVLKWELVHPAPQRYDFGPADNYVAFGLTNRMFIVGHNLIWHLQTPDWVFRNFFGAPIDREALIERMRDHIFTVMGRYKGKINGWDVVNEAVEEDGTLRKSPWQRIIGDDYLVKAYQFAHQADPSAKLYYNDYSLENAVKRAGAIRLVKKLQAAGVPLAAVGMQGHYTLDSPSPAEVENAIDQLSALGVKVMITELDIDVLAGSGAVPNPYPNGLPEAVQQKLARRYAELFGVFVKHRRQISRVTFWGVADGDSWLNYFPIPGRTNYPLLFDRAYHPKPAFARVIAAAAR